MRMLTCVAGMWMLLLAAMTVCGAETGDANASAQEPWIFPDGNGTFVKGDITLDGRSAITRAFFMPTAWDNVSLKAEFMVDPADQGVLACGFIVRAENGASYYYVHFDKTQAILCRSSVDTDWIEIKRVGDLDKPAGKWHEGALECTGDALKVSLNGKLLFEAQDTTIKAGRIGFYASQGLAHIRNIKVNGDGIPTDAPFTIPPPMFVHVCKDAGAGAYEAFPDVCRLNDGRLMSVFYAGYGHVAMPNEKLPNGGRVSCCYSSDEGRTWTSAETLYDGPDDDRDPSIAQLSDGRLICNYFTLRAAEGQNPPWTGLGTWMVTSTDLGKTWSAPKCISADYYCSSPVRELKDGRLMLGLYAEKDGKGWGAVVFSEDKGETWGPVIDIDNGGMPLDAETDLIELTNGTLYAAERGRNETMAWSASTDGGKTWSVSKPYGFPGHCPYLLRTPDGILLMAHRLPKTSLHYSLDEGATWSENVPVDDVGGAYPSMVNLKDGTVLIVYYEEGEGSSIRAKRFQATRDGIKWIPVAGDLPK